jgi:hypothetical protein
MTSENERPQEAVYLETANGNFIVDDEGSGYILHKNALKDDNLLFEEDKASGEAEEEAQLPSAEEVDLSIFDDIETPEQEEKVEEEDNEPETLEFTKFKDDFKKHLGLDLEEALIAVQELQNLRAELYIKEQERDIQDSWGVDNDTFKKRMKDVRAYAFTLAETKPELFKKLDNVEGVKLIWSKLEQDRQRVSLQQKQVPGIQRNSQRTPEGTSKKYEYTYSQIQNMSRTDYEKSATRIAQAFASGRVDMKR